MSEVFFYHLQRQPLEKALPLLIEKCLERGWKVAVQAASMERISALDDLLWTYSDSSFLPHGTEKEGGAETQTVLLTTLDSNLNTAQVRILLDGVATPELAPYGRVLVLFDGNDDEAVARERERWRELKAGGHELAYWQQDERGVWGRKA